MAPKRRSSAATPATRSRSSSPAPSTTRVHEAEIQQVFGLLCGFSGAQEALAASALQQVQRKLPAGSALSAARQKASPQAEFLQVLAEAEFPGEESLQFPAFYDWQMKLLKQAGHSFTARKQMLLGIIDSLEDLSKKQRAAASLEAAETTEALKEAIKAAKALLGPSAPEVVAAQKRLDSLGEAFEIQLTSLTAEHSVQVKRSQTLGWLRDVVAELFDKKAYRIQMASEGARLDQDHLSLESCGIGPGTGIGVTFREQDPFQEMELSEFLELLVEHKAFSKHRSEEIDAQVKRGSLQKSKVIARYSADLQEMIDDVALREAWLLVDKSQKEKEAEMFADGSGMMARIDELEHHTETVKTKVVEVEGHCAVLAQAANKISEDAMPILELCLPSLQDATGALDALDKRDLMDFIALSRPPEAVAHAFSAVGIFLGLPSTGSADLNMAWKMSCKAWALNPVTLLQQMKDYAKDNISEDVLKKTKAFVESDAYAPEVLRSTSSVAAAFSQWARAMHIYHATAQKIAPLRDRLRLKQLSLAASYDILQHRQERLKRLQDEFKRLQDKVEEMERMSKIPTAD